MSSRCRVHLRYPSDYDLTLFARKPGNVTGFNANRLTALPQCPSNISLTRDEMADDNRRGRYAAIQIGPTRYTLLDYTVTELRCDADIVFLISKGSQGLGAEKRRISDVARLP